MTPDEERKLDNKKCIVLIRGCDPVVDFKFNTFKHPMFKRSGDGGGKWYTHNPQDKKRMDIIDKETANCLKKEAGEDGNVIITTITVTTFSRKGRLKRHIVPMVSGIITVASMYLQQKQKNGRQNQQLQI